MFKINAKGLLEGPKVTQAIVDKNSGTFALGHSDTIVLHYTGGSTLEGAVTHLSNPSIKASAHLVVGRDGEVVQLVPFLLQAWHAGRSQYQGREGINQYSIGIEMVNVGPVQRAGAQYVATFGQRFNQDDVIEATHQHQAEPCYWQSYTPTQIETVAQLCQCLCLHYPIAHLVGHDDIAPGRKRDPGPAFPIQELREQLFERRDQQQESISVDLGKAQVIASRLNVRQGPSAQAALIRAPLDYGHALHILAEQDGWYQVVIEEQGWVKKEWVERLNV